MENDDDIAMDRIIQYKVKFKHGGLSKDIKTDVAKAAFQEPSLFHELKSEIVHIIREKAVRELILVFLCEFQ